MVYPNHSLADHSPVTRWRRFDTDRQALMREQLERVLEVGLFNDNR